VIRRVLRTPADVEAVLATVTDPIVREALQQRLASMKRIAAGHDPFARLPVPPSDEPW
jgi:hypothetical protein